MITKSWDKDDENCKDSRKIGDPQIYGGLLGNLQKAEIGNSGDRSKWSKLTLDCYSS